MSHPEQSRHLATTIPGPKSEALIGRKTAAVARGVVGDVRPPDLLRLAPVPLAVDEAGLVEGIARLRDLVAAGEHLDLPARRARVT